MNAWYQLVLLTLVAFAIVQAASQETIAARTTIVEAGQTCPTAEQRQALMDDINEEVRVKLQNFPYTMSCGGTTGWRRIAYLNMTDSSHECPGELVESMYSGKRLCGQHPTATASCTPATFSTNEREYTAVCGKIFGYQYGDTTAFGFYTANGASDTYSIDTYYIDGVTVTHGSDGTREHIWSFANGLSEDRNDRDACPCAPNANGYTVPPFIGNDYFCESGTVSYQGLVFYDEHLWDGEGCSYVGNTCCTFNNPPYFTKELSSATTNDIEVRVCSHDALMMGGSLVEIIELYVK